MAKGFWQGGLVKGGENPLGVVQETANGTVRNGAGDDGNNGSWEWNPPVESVVKSGRNSVQPPAAAPDTVVSVIAHTRRRRG